MEEGTKRTEREQNSINNDEERIRKELSRLKEEQEGTRCKEGGEMDEEGRGRNGQSSVKNTSSPPWT